MSNDIRRILFGSFNRNKLAEIQSLMPAEVELLGAIDLAGMNDVEETGTTLEANAQLKAESYAEQSGLPCFADDTGLEVSALHGAPGVYSARYAGPEADAEANMAKLLHELSDVQDCAAQFRTVIAFAQPGAETQFFEGKLEGWIAAEQRGAHGFGYDPVFVPQGETRSLAEMPMAEKNALSHRGRALRAFVTFLNQILAGGRV